MRQAGSQSPEWIGNKNLRSVPQGAAEIRSTSSPYTNRRFVAEILKYKQKYFYSVSNLHFSHPITDKCVILKYNISQNSISALLLSPCHHNCQHNTIYLKEVTPNIYTSVRKRKITPSDLFRNEKQRICRFYIWDLHLVQRKMNVWIDLIQTNTRNLV